MAHQVLNASRAPAQMLPLLSGNDAGGREGVDSPSTSAFESGPSRPPTPHGAGFPDNFGEVVSGIYRSSYPLPVHFGSISRLNLKTIITLVKEPLSADYREMMEENDIQYHLIPILPNKTPGVCTPQSTIDEVLQILLDPANHPVLVHCNKGKHRTGCMMACFRRVQGWSMDSTIAEYLRYAYPKQRSLDQTFIGDYDVTKLAGLAEKVRAPSWIPDVIGPLKPAAVNGKDAAERKR